jgi:hypothetical protein
MKAAMVDAFERQRRLPALARSSNTAQAVLRRRLEGATRGA